MNNFYNKISLKTLKGLLKKNFIKLETKLNINTNFNKINSIDKSESEDLTFFHNNKYLDKLKNTKAKACLITKKNISYLVFQLPVFLIIYTDLRFLSRILRYLDLLIRVYNI